MEMEYYGNNDWRDYCLAHHGIVGMKWGIRRFQPYSTTGPRKGGKTGKEVGLAKKIGAGLSSGVKMAGKALSSGTKKLTAKVKKARADRIRKVNLEKARKVKAEKEDIMKSGSAERLLERKELFSNEEIDKFVERAAKETKVAELRKAQIEAGFEAADMINMKAKKIADYMNTANTLMTRTIDIKKNLDNIKDLSGNSEKKAKEKLIDDAIKSGDPEKILNLSKDATTSQLKDASSRLSYIDSIAKKVVSKSDTGSTEQAQKTDTSTTSKTESKPDTSGIINDTTMDLINRVAGKVNTMPKSSGIGSKDYSDQKAFSKNDIGDITKRLIERTSGVTKTTETRDSGPKTETKDVGSMMMDLMNRSAKSSSVTSSESHKTGQEAAKKILSGSSSTNQNGSTSVNDSLLKTYSELKKAADEGAAIAKSVDTGRSMIDDMLKRGKR